MARHVSLPKKSKAPSLPESTPAQSPTSTVGVEKFLADRVTSVAENGQYVYLVRAKLKNSTLSSMFFLCHVNQYDQRVFGDMMKDALAVINGTRIPTRRQRLAEQKTPIIDYVKTNETLFEGDADVLQVVLCDKFGFRKLFYTPIEGEIIPTVVS